MVAKSKFNKDKKIKIFQIIKSRDEDGNVIEVKKYIHPIDKGICAYYRDLKNTEVLSNKALGDESTAMLIIGKRFVSKDMFVEYKRNGAKHISTYNINGIDSFTDSGEDIKLTISLCKNEIVFDEVEGTEW